MQNQILFLDFFNIQNDIKYETNAKNPTKKHAGFLKEMRFFTNRLHIMFLNMIFGRCFDVLESLMPNKRVGYTKGIVEVTK